MMFKNKTESEIVSEDRKLIEKNSDTVGKLTILVSDTVFLSKLKNLQEKLKYLKPVRTEEAMNADKTIADKIDDLKIELSRFNDSISIRADSIMTEILSTVVNRND